MSVTNQRNSINAAKRLWVRDILPPLEKGDLTTALGNLKHDLQHYDRELITDVRPDFFEKHPDAEMVHMQDSRQPNTQALIAKSGNVKAVNVGHEAYHALYAAISGQVGSQVTQVATEFAHAMAKPFMHGYSDKAVALLKENYQTLKAAGQHFVDKVEDVMQQETGAYGLTSFHAEKLGSSKQDLARDEEAFNAFTMALRELHKLENS